MQGISYGDMKPRTLANRLKEAAGSFPAVVLTGPRQSGKTTLLRALFGRTHRFVSLENPDVRARAQSDPIGFLAREAAPPVILDEIQYAPDLLSYIKTRIDERRRRAGEWILSGSQLFPLMRGVSESLAGRAAVLTLFPFSYAERIGRGDASLSVEKWLKRLGEKKSPPARRAPLAEVLLRGHYPEIASRRTVPRELWCGSYLATYLERDIRNLSQVGDLNLFERFLRLVAVRTGQLLNLSDLARDLGLSVPTVRRWLSLLETGGQVLLVHPYYRNLGKRLVKSPKLYFTDTALATYLLGLNEPDALQGSPHFGAIFETFIAVDLWKRFLHHGNLPALSYLRTRDGAEVDLVVEAAGRLHLFEIKTAATILPRHADGLRRFKKELKERAGIYGVVSRAAKRFSLGDNIMNYPWHEFLIP